MCHTRHTHRATAPQSDAAVLDRATASQSDPGLLASDAERESAVGVLRDHGAAGRLEVAELEQRIGAAYAARTHGELAALLRDLPAAAPRRAVARRSAREDHGWAAFLQVNALLIAIWALSGAGYFWPAWVIAWWGLALVMKSAPRLLRLR